MNLYEQIEKECLSDGLDFEHQRCNTTKLKAICAEFERRAPAPEQFDDADKEALAAIAKGGMEYAKKIRKIVGDPMTSVSVNTVTGEVTTHKPQAQAGPVAEPFAYAHAEDANFSNPNAMLLVSYTRDEEYKLPLYTHPIPAAPAVPESWRAVIDAMRRQYVPNSLGDDLLFHVAEELEKLTASPEQQP